MYVKDAVVCRMREIMDSRNLNNNSLAVLVGVTPSTIYSLMDSSRRHISLNTLKIICDGLDISLCEFFNSDFFYDLDDELK